MNASNQVKSKIMKAAWNGAKQAAAKFGGKASQYFSECLKAVWANLNTECLVNPVKITNTTGLEFAKTFKCHVDMGRTVTTNYQIQRAIIMGNFVL
jgi:hypothetical protein